MGNARLKKIVSLRYRANKQLRKFEILTTIGQPMV